MEIEEREKTEAEVRHALSQVRLVFELGFPEDLVVRAEEVIVSAKDGGRLLRNGEIRYPACWVLNIINIARSREGRGFWNGDGTEYLRKSPNAMSPNDLAKKTIDAFNALGLETFEEIVASEGALTNLTPIFMHSGIPLNNIPELVNLIDRALERHRIGADEQIRDWTRTSNGFGQLWRAARILLKSGGAIASDLLERINEALIYPERATETGLPNDLIDALANASKRERAKRHGSDATLPKPYVYLDPYSCQGPTLHIPSASPNIIDLWKVTGSNRSEIQNRSNEPWDIPLNPKDEYEVTGYCKGDIVTRRIIHAFRDLPIQFFKASNGRLIERRGTQIDVSDKGVLAIHHQKIVSSAFSSTESYPLQSGSWGEWKISDVNIDQISSLDVFDTVRSESIQIVRAPVRPHLLEAEDGLNIATSNGLPVYTTPPKLAIETGSIDPSLVRVIIEIDGLTSETHLSELEKDEYVLLDSLMPESGTYSVRVTGPIGFGMPVHRFVLIRNLQIIQSPAIALPHQEVSVTATNGASKSVCNPKADLGECDLIFDGVNLTIQIVRITWAIRTKEQLSTRLDTTLFNVGVDQLTYSSESYLSIDTGINAYIQVGIAIGSTSEHIDSPHQRSSRRTIDLATFADTARHLNSEVINVQIRINDGSWVQVGCITATYSASLTDINELKTDSGHFVSATIHENRPFKNRVLRLWPLDRPWDSSFKFELDNDSRNSCTVRLPAEFRSGAYRIGIRIEDPWSPPSSRPRRDDRTAFDINLELGQPLDLNSAVDRLIHAIKSGDLPPQEDDVCSHGHVIISLLDQMYRDEGVQGLMGLHAARAYNAFGRDPSGIVRHIVRALELSLLDRDSRVAIALALLPTIFRIEDELNLAIPDEVEELVWSEIPWIAAILEPWNDKTDAPQLWSRHLGWPRSEPNTDDEPDIKASQAVDFNSNPVNPPLREVMIDNFDQYVRTYVTRDPEFWKLVLGGFIGSLSDQPLSRDAEFLAVVATIPKAQEKKKEVLAWRDQWNSTISSAHGYLRFEPNRFLIDQYDVPAAWMDQGQYKWILKDISALANFTILTRGASQPSTQALIAIYEHLPEWVSYSLLLNLSLAPYHKKTKD
jgi:hypothetical protein